MPIDNKATDNDNSAERKQQAAEKYIYSKAKLIVEQFGKVDEQAGSSREQTITVREGYGMARKDVEKKSVYTSLVRVFDFDTARALIDGKIETLEMLITGAGMAGDEGSSKGIARLAEVFNGAATFLTVKFTREEGYYENRMEASANLQLTILYGEREVFKAATSIGGVSEASMGSERSILTYAPGEVWEKALESLYEAATLSIRHEQAVTERQLAQKDAGNRKDWGRPSTP